MNIYFDTEFIEDGRTIDLVSIGICTDDDRELYLISSDYDETKANPWVVENVLWYINDDPAPRYTKAEIAHRVLEFVREGTHPTVDFWAYYAAYDWVVLCQLFGRMVDLPSPFPFYCNDLMQLCHSLGDPTLPPQIRQHHALEDARWNRTMHRYLNKRR